MLHVDVICLGKLDQRFLREGCAEYQKRLGSYCECTVTELREEPLPQAPSPAQVAAALEREGKQIEEKIRKNTRVIGLCIEGELHSSESFAREIGNTMQSGQRICFIIGSSHGLSAAIKARCDMLLSMSHMTFPHQLCRLLFMEQLYRAFTILNHKKYHK